MRGKWSTFDQFGFVYGYCYVNWSIRTFEYILEKFPKQKKNGSVNVFWRGVLVENKVKYSGDHWDGVAGFITPHPPCERGRADWAGFRDESQRWPMAAWRQDVWELRTRDDETAASALWGSEEASPCVYRDFCTSTVFSPSEGRDWSDSGKEHVLEENWNVLSGSWGKSGKGLRSQLLRLLRHFHLLGSIAVIYLLAITI